MEDEENVAVFGNVVGVPHCFCDIGCIHEMALARSSGGRRVVDDDTPVVQGIGSFRNISP